MNCSNSLFREHSGNAIPFTVNFFFHTTTLEKIFLKKTCLKKEYYYDDEFYLKITGFIDHCSGIFHVLMVAGKLSWP